MGKQGLDDCGEFYLVWKLLSLIEIADGVAWNSLTYKVCVFLAIQVTR